jgi:hypothetical protein
MSELDNLPKIEIKADLTKVTENAYNDTLKEPLKSSSKITSTVLNFFYNTVLYPMQKYNLYAEDKLKKYAEDLQNRAKKIPEKNLVNPRVNILGPTVEGLKYNLDEEYIKEMFTNILLSDMDNRKQSKVLPSYIEIIKQLSKEDAEFLILLKKFDGNFCSISINIKEQNSEGYSPLDKYIIYGYDHNSISNTTTFGTSKLNPLVLDNLIMHGLIKQDYNIYYTHPIANEQYTTLFDQVKGKYRLLSNQSLIYDKGLVCLTDFGKNFIDICLS